MKQDRDRQSRRSSRRAQTVGLRPGRTFGGGGDKPALRAKSSQKATTSGSSASARSREAATVARYRAAVAVATARPRTTTMGSPNGLLGSAGSRQRRDPWTPREQQAPRRQRQRDPRADSSGAADIPVAAAPGYRATAGSPRFLRWISRDSGRA